MPSLRKSERSDLYWFGVCAVIMLLAIAPAVCSFVLFLSSSLGLDSVPNRNRRRKTSHPW